MRKVVSVNATLNFSDGIDDGFLISVAIFRDASLMEMLAEGDLSGPVADWTGTTLPLNMKVIDYMDGGINGSVLYMDHKIGPLGSGKDNSVGVVSLEWIFADGSTSYNGATPSTPLGYPFTIGTGDGVSRDTRFTLSFPATWVVNNPAP